MQEDGEEHLRDLLTPLLAMRASRKTHFRNFDARGVQNEESEGGA